jgi:hypothetical protein
MADLRCKLRGSLVLDNRDRVLEAEVDVRDAVNEYGGKSVNRFRVQIDSYLVCFRVQILSMIVFYYLYDNSILIKI